MAYYAFLSLFDLIFWLSGSLLPEQERVHTQPASAGTPSLPSNEENRTRFCKLASVYALALTLLWSGIGFLFLAITSTDLA
jgi:hypothetical protein